MINDLEKRREEEDEDFDEDEADVSSDIQLGFAEKQCNRLFLNTDWRTWDGGKIGGLPVSQNSIKSHFPPFSHLLYSDK